MSVYPQEGEGSLCDHYLGLFKLVHLGTHPCPPSLFSPNRDISSPGHVQTCSPRPHHRGTSPGTGWKTGSRPSTERYSCYHPQMKLREGNILRGVCLSTGGSRPEQGGAVLTGGCHPSQGVQSLLEAAILRRGCSP